MEKFLKQTIRAAGTAILKKWKKVGVKYTKEDATDVVTEADLISNKIIVDAIRKKYPTHAIISEESGADAQADEAEYTWIIDPLDGTRNFSRGASFFGVLIGVAHRGQMHMGAIYMPVTDELVFAARGRGAFLNGKRLRASTGKIFAESWGSVSSHVNGRRGNMLQNLIRIAAREPCWVSSVGCAALSALQVAANQRDWAISDGGGMWDYAACALVLREAGYRVTNLGGKPWKITDRNYVVANNALHRRLMRDVVRKK